MLKFVPSNLEVNRGRLGIAAGNYIYVKDCLALQSLHILNPVKKTAIPESALAYAIAAS